MCVSSQNLWTECDSKVSHRCKREMYIVDKSNMSLSVGAKLLRRTKFEFAIREKLCFFFLFFSIKNVDQ